MTGRHDYPELATAKPPAEIPPVYRETCPMCAGAGWRETRVDDNGIGHGWACIYCIGTGFVWVEK